MTPDIFETPGLYGLLHLVKVLKTIDTEEYYDLGSGIAYYCIELGTDPNIEAEVRLKLEINDKIKRLQYSSVVVFIPYETGEYLVLKNRYGPTTNSDNKILAKLIDEV